MERSTFKGIFKMLSKFLIFLTLVFSSTLFAQELKLALNWKAEPQFGGFYAAPFEQQGLKIKILEGGSGTPTIQMLASGQVDYAIVSADEIILAHDRGAEDVIAVFATYQTNPQGILVHAERNFKKVDDVFQSEGVLLWQSGLPYAQFIQKKYGPLKVKTAPYLGGIGNFQKDPHVSQQCFVTSEPLAAEKAGLKVKTFLVADTGYNPYTTVLAVRASRLKKYRAEVEEVVKLVRMGWEKYLNSAQETNVKMAALNKAMDMETFQKSAEAQKPLIRNSHGKLGDMTSDRWKTLSNQLLELKLIHQKVSPEDLFQNL
jgi:NitT/TauT family transport system substrate-binding protein